MHEILMMRSILSQFKPEKEGKKKKQLTSTDDGIDLNAIRVDLSGELTNGLIWVFVGVRIDIGSVGSAVRKQQGGDGERRIYCFSLS